MSRENVEIVARALGHLSETGELDLGLYDPDVVWQTRSDGPGHLTYEGLEGLKQGLSSLRDAWAQIQGDVLELIDHGDVVVSVIEWNLESQSGVRLQTVEAWVTRLRDGKIVRIEQHATKAEAFEAAGIEPE